ncbi:hypothetical protein EV702DRAFT_1051055 [Suillus placidus]|uniref:Uncharacterized protein n=1 Tax=Suillus placidus TaxID=48579 RepID=A0A9P6ZIM0_9AGAM|nr:hypothetical protein EV702DRAFT_1051055 [Suillus placidus]
MSNRPPKSLCMLSMHTGPVLTIRWAHFEGWLASGSDDEIVMIWGLDPSGSGKVFGRPGHCVFASYSAAIFIVGGSGITFALSAVQDILQRDSEGASLVKITEVIWSVQHSASLTPLVPQLLAALIQQIIYAPLKISVHYTCASDNPPGKDILPPGLTLTAGRPKIAKVLDTMMSRAVSYGSNVKASLDITGVMVRMLEDAGLLVMKPLGSSILSLSHSGEACRGGKFYMIVHCTFLHAFIQQLSRPTGEGMNQATEEDHGSRAKHSYLMQHSMQKTAGIIATMVSQRPHSIKQRHLVAKAISYACWYIRAYVEDTDGLPWISEVLEAGLLPLLLAIEPWVRHLKDNNDEDWEPLWLLFSTIFPKYAIFRSVLKVMGRSIKALNAVKAVDRPKPGSTMHKHWSTLETLVMTRLNLLETDDANEAHVDSCQSSKAPSSAALVAFTCITAARNVRFTIGNKAAIKHIVVEYKLAMPTAAIHALGPAVVEIDYTCTPFRIGVGCTESLPVPDACKCDRLMQQKWDTMVELAWNSNTPGQKLLICAFIPCGSAPKVKLQLIPIKRIIPGYDPSQDHDPTEASDTFDHLYLCAGISFTIVDHSYPVETLRLMNKEMDALTTEGKETTTDPAHLA